VETNHGVFGYRVKAEGRDLMLKVERPVARLVSSEYYFTYARAARVSAHPCSGGETDLPSADRFLPQAYFPDLIKLAVIRFSTSRVPSRHSLEILVRSLASASTQFPALILEGKLTRPALERIIAVLNPLVEQFDMYFLLMPRLSMIPEEFDPVFHAHREVFYSSRNRIYLKCLLEVDAGGDELLKRLEILRRREIAADLVFTFKGGKPPLLPDLGVLIESEYDSYSERNIELGPNVWVDLARPVQPARLLELDRRLVQSGVRRLYLHPSIHRLLNGYASLHPGGIRGRLVFATDGSLTLEDLGKRVRLGSWKEENLGILLSRQPIGKCDRDATVEKDHVDGENRTIGNDAAGDDHCLCNELRHFCLRSPLHCDYLQSLVVAMADHPAPGEN